jgi:malate dehydrogenase (oxaloacetate-decarboxylating)
MPWGIPTSRLWKFDSKLLSNISPRLIGSTSSHRYFAMPSLLSSVHKATKPLEKHPKFGSLPLSTSGPQDCALVGSALLSTPYFNKGVAFTVDERQQFKLHGLLPQNVQTLNQQVKRAYQQYSTRQDNLAKNTFMTSLAAQNQVLYFRVS